MEMSPLLRRQQLTERILQVKESKGMTWEQIARALYQILDDIDTEDDRCRENDEAFRHLVMQHQARKNQYLFSPDGYALERVPTHESTMTDWARNELQMAGLFDKDSDYEGMLGEAVMELMDRFSEQGHSGFSAGLVSSIFDRLSHHKPLSELTSDPLEWNEVGSQWPARTSSGTGKVYQSRRSPDCFSEDGGLTYYSIDDPCFEATEENGATYMHYCPETWAKVTIHTAKKKE